MKLSIYIVLALFLISVFAEQAQPGKPFANIHWYRNFINLILFLIPKDLADILIIPIETVLNKEVMPKKAQATFGKIFLFILTLAAAGYGLKKLNNYHNTYVERMVVDDSFGKKPVQEIKPEEIVDNSSPIVLYAEDGESGVLDILHKVKTETESYEMISYESTSKKLEDTESSFFSNASVRTADDLELQGFDSQPKEGYEAPPVYKSKWNRISRYLTNQRESLL